jgi:integration host factor subunit beta
MLPFLAAHGDHDPTVAAVETGPISMTKADLTQHLADKTKLTWQHAEFVVDAIFACVEQSLRRGERIELRGFGTFQARSYKGYEGRNPKTGEVVHLAPRRLPFFKVSKNLAAKINGGGKKKGSMESVQS